AYKKQGFIAAGDEAESVSKTLEYAFDDWCIAQYAKALGKDSIYHVYIERAQYYKNLFNPQNGFMQAKMNGAFAPHFDPAEVNFNFTEANAWQYSLFVLHDIEGMVNLHGGANHFEKHLDELFSTEMALSGRHQVDITGLIGQYAHGNEPSHHMAYLYNFIAKPYKTQEKVHQILVEQYQNTPVGLSGNEDCGQMSAWYVLSAMGFYSVTPGLDYYTIGTPHLKAVTINLENGKSFVIQANALTDDHYYIQSATLNGKDFNQSYIKHADIVNGGKLIFEMGPTPNPNWGLDIPVSSIPKTDQSCPVPYFEAVSQTFSDSLKIVLKSTCETCEILYSFSDDFQVYTSPITVRKDAVISAFSKCNNQKSKAVQASYQKIQSGRSISIASEYSNQYAASGPNALIDYLRGSPNFRTGYWQGYQGQDVIATVDLGSIQTVNSIYIGCLQDIKSWIWFPKSVEIWTAVDGNKFELYGNIENDFEKDAYGAFTKDFTANQSRDIRFIKVKLTYPGDCPTWHLGAGGKAWVFVDEIVIN
ncbi:MAG: GH92 family glycosyl hydrolase, partial [Putridiphycobacter sp.]|nr:GH92 family glycosyl hydrolase [Putridiphycobacter sp.]